jgi:alkylation response protein AidB-like acyl-CoA dehydrogenase
MKIFGAALGRDLTALSCEILGLEVCDYEVTGSWDFWQDFLLSLIWSIGGGTSEIQHEIVGARYFGIPRS